MKRKCAVGPAQRKEQLITSRKLTEEVTFDLSFMRIIDFSILSTRKDICVKSWNMNILEML